MFALAAAGAAAVIAIDAIVSANIVGYMEKDNTGLAYAPVGAMFMTVGQQSFRLGDIVPEDGTLNASTEYLQEFNPTTGAIGQKYYYVDETTARSPNPMRRWADPTLAVGWWKEGYRSGFTNTGVGTAESANDLLFAAGSGFYSNFAGKKAKLNFKGEVLDVELQIDLTGKAYAPVINYLPRTITLGEIVPEDGTLNASTEYLQEFNPTTGAIGQKYYYVDETTARSTNPMRRWADPTLAVGWWKEGYRSGFTNTGVGTAESADDVQIAPGAGLYSNFAGKKAKLNFPKAIVTASQN